MTSDIHRTQEGWYVIDADLNRTRAIEETGRLDWDNDMLDFVTHFIKPDDVVVDAGASIGDCTIAFQEAVGSRGYVIAYEPLRVAYQCLTLNCQGSNLSCYPLALGDKYNHLNMRVFDANDYGTSYMTNEGLGDIAVVTLDRHWRVWPELAQRHVDFIKIDVEGMEHMVLAGAKDLIRKNHPVLFIECYKQALARYHTSVDSIRSLLEAMSYGHFQIYEPYKDWHWDYFNVLATV